MKIEKVNDHQIRCTLTKSDLADRQMKISELAYGTDKAKSLFRDMMEQAAYEFGFEAEDIPLMIEAIPLSGDCIVLIITKVEDPEELDSRFGKFAQGSDENEDVVSTASFSVTADDVIDLFKKLRNEIAQAADRLDAAKALPAGTAEVSVAEDLHRIYEFDTLDEVIRLAGVLKGYYNAENTLYKDPTDGYFTLIIHQGDHKPEDFNRICNIISEYGVVIKYSKGQDRYFEEHGSVFMEKDALQRLSTMFDQN